MFKDKISDYEHEGGGGGRCCGTFCILITLSNVSGLGEERSVYC